MLAQRTAALRALIRYEMPIEPALDFLASCGWDCEHTLVWLPEEDVASILDRFLEGSLTAAQVTEWAEELECRDGIEAAPHLRDLLFILANPDMNGPVVPSAVAELRTSLRTGGAV